MNHKCKSSCSNCIIINNSIIMYLFDQHVNTHSSSWCVSLHVIYHLFVKVFAHENLLLKGSNLFGKCVLNPVISFSHASITPRCKAMKMLGSSKWPFWFYIDGQSMTKAPMKFQLYMGNPHYCTMCFHPPESLSCVFSRMITISDQRPVDHLRSILAMASIGQSYGTNN